MLLSCACLVSHVVVFVDCLFLLSPVDNRKSMIEHGACLVDMCNSDDVERTRVVTKLITAIAEAGAWCQT